MWYCIVQFWGIADFLEDATWSDISVEMWGYILCIRLQIGAHGNGMDRSIFSESM